MYFEWKDEYTVGVAVIDEQHKRIFEIGRDAAGMIFNQNEMIEDAMVDRIIAELIDYTEFHFKYEEAYLLEIGYASYEFHRLEHEHMIEAIERIKTSSVERQQKQTILVLMDFIFEWISNHILNCDLKFKLAAQPD